MLFAFQASAADMSQTDIYQAELWIKNVRDLYIVGDYPTLWYFCQKILQFYPETSYAAEAQEFVKKTAKLKKNRTREKLRNDPSLTYDSMW